MPLLIHIKPGESLITGRGVITNRSKYRTHLEIKGDMPILHEKELLREADANSPCKRFYFTIQTMYLLEDAKRLRETYLAQVRDIQQAQPDTAAYFKRIDEELHAGQYHKALKEARRLIEYEAGLLPPAR